MFNRRVKLFLFAVLFLTAFNVQSYDSLVIHPSLTKAAVEVYNKESKNKITPKQASWVVEGSIAEDTDPRYLNHFYDPTTGKGLSEGMFKGLPTVSWAKKQNSLSGDYSLKAILNNYRQGNNKRAFQGVGHMLHLIHDMSVPAHTRNDAHPDGDPYEAWAKKYGNFKYNYDIYRINNLDEALNNLANYSHSNFYSKDTMDDNIAVFKYKNEKDINGVYFKYAYSDNYKLYKIKSYRLGEEKFLDYKVSLDYWNMLHPKAVGYSAGAIDYFVREFEKIDQEKEVENISLWQRTKNNLNNFKNSAKYVWGDTFLASRHGFDKSFGKIKNGFFTATENVKQSAETGISKTNNIVKTNIVQVNAISDKIPEIKVLGVKISSTKDVAAPIPAQLQAQDIGGNVEEYSLSSSSEESRAGGDGEVARVIDGDTIVLKNGERVRYIGINAPEISRKKCMSQEARIKNEELLKSGRVKLKKDPSVDKDKYGRLLRYVYVNDVFVNEQLVREGLAKVFFCEKYMDNCPVTTDNERRQEIIQANKYAEKNSVGVYSSLCEEKLEVEIKDTIASQNTSTAQAPQNVVFFGGGGGGSSLNIDNTPPQVNITKYPVNLVSSIMAEFEFEADEEVSFECQLNNNEWEACSSPIVYENLNSGENIFQVKATDASGNIGELQEYGWMIDLPMELPLYSSSTQIIINNTSSLDVILNNLESEYSSAGFEVGWLASSSDQISTTTKILVFDVEYKVNNGDWIGLINATTSTSTVFDIKVDGGDEIFFRVRSQDDFGNIGEWSSEKSTSLKEGLINNIIISEFVTRGVNGAYDEFVELYNPTSAAVDLTGWRLQTKSASSDKWISRTGILGIVQGIIQSKGYFLLAAKSYSFSVIPDYIHESNWGLSDSGGSIRIINDNEEEIDKVGYGSALDSEGDAADADLSDGASLERKAVSTSTSESMQDDGEHYLLGNGYDSDDNKNDFVKTQVPSPQSSLGLNQVNNLEISDGPVHLWHFDECRDGILKDSVGAADMNQTGNWVAGKWDCGIYQHLNLDSLNAEFTEPVDANNLSFSLYYKLNTRISRFYFEFYNNNSDKISFKFDSSLTEFWGLPDKRYVREWQGLGLDDGWHQLTVVINKDLGYLIIYRDGEELLRKEIDFDLNQFSNFMIKGDMDRDNYTLVDEIAIWNRSLDGDEVKNIYDNNLPVSPYNEKPSQLMAVKEHYWNFDEGVGDVVYDQVGEGNIILDNRLWLNDGISSSSILTSFSIQRDVVVDFAQPFMNNDVSVDFWWKNISYPKEGRFVVKLRDDNNSDIFGATITSANFYYYFNNDFSMTRGLLPNDNEWHHFALVYDAYEYEFNYYIDGQLTITKPMPYLFNPITKLYLRAENENSQIDELSIWSGALKPEDVQELYNLYK